MLEATAPILAPPRKLGQPKELRWTGSEHVGEGKTEIVDAILAEVEGWLDRDGEG